MAGKTLFLLFFCIATTCSAAGRTSSTIVSIATPETYVVYPKDGSSNGQTSSISQLLRGFVDNASQITTSGDSDLGIDFWSLPLTSDNATTLQKNGNVRLVFGD